MRRIKVSNLVVDVIKKEIKNIHLAVYPPSGRVRIAVPLKTSDESVRLFIISKISWIKKQKAKFENTERQSERNYITRESHYYQGKRYLLNIIEQDGPAKVEIRNKKFIDIYVKKGSTSSRREKLLTEWYRKQLKEQVPALLKKWEKIIGVKTEDWGIKQMKTKWGTCNIKAKRIWLNLELIKKPEHCLEYILVHELVHLLERNHNEHFIAHMDKFLPPWRNYKKQLNQFILPQSSWTY
jgi:predicted metal-dependent hydrolase